MAVAHTHPFNGPFPGLLNSTVLHWRHFIEIKIKLNYHSKEDKPYPERTEVSNSTVDAGENSKDRIQESLAQPHEDEEVESR